MNINQIQTSYDLEVWLIQEYGQEKYRPKLDRVTVALADYLKKADSLKIITVGGTNGKGSTCQALANLIDPQKINYGLWTSPHVVSVTERFIFNDEKVELSQLMASLKKFHEQSLQLSYYEILFCAFIDLAFQKNCQVLILEVGLGGRYDAVNVFNADMSAIVSISRDHTEILGCHYRDILAEKIQIARKDRPLLTTIHSQYMKEKLVEFNDDIGASWWDLTREASYQNTIDFMGQNQFLARSLFDQLQLHFDRPIGRADQERGLLAGRGQTVLWRGKTLEFRGAHNVDGVRKLVQFLRAESYNINTLLLLGFSQRNQKDLENMLEIYGSFFKRAKVASTFDHPRALQETQTLKLPTGFEWCDDWQDIFVSGTEAENIFISGSFFFLGEVMRSFNYFR